MTGKILTTEARREWKSGWHLTALTIFGLTAAPTVLPPYTIGIFVAPLEATFGWSRAAIQATIAFSTGLGLISGPMAGWLVQRFGPRRAILSGIVGMAAALAYAGAIGGELWQLYLAYALMALLGAGAGAVSWSYLIATRFETSRGLALGLALSGTGLCAVLMPRIAAQGIALWDWRGAYWVLAAFVGLIVLPICYLVLPRQFPTHAVKPSHSPQEHSGTSLAWALRGYHFWLIGLSSAGIYAAVGGLIPNLIPVLSGKGVPLPDAVWIISIFGLSVVVGRIVIGALVDHLWAPAVATAVLIPAACACIMLNADASLTTYACAAALLGAATGMEFDMLGFLVARYFGLVDYARIYGRIFMFVAGSAGLAPLGYGALYDRTHSYELPLMLSSVLLCASAVGLLALGRYPVLKGPVTRRDGA